MKRCGGLILNRRGLSGHGSHNPIWNTNDREPRLVLTGLAWCIGCAFERPLTDASASLIRTILRRPSCVRPVAVLMYIYLQATRLSASLGDQCRGPVEHHICTVIS